MTTDTPTPAEEPIGEDAASLPSRSVEGGGGEAETWPAKPFVVRAEYKYADRLKKLADNCGRNTDYKIEKRIIYRSVHDTDPNICELFWWESRVCLRTHSYPDNFSIGAHVNPTLTTIESLREVGEAYVPTAYLKAIRITAASPAPLPTGDATVDTIAKHAGLSADATLALRGIVDDRPFDAATVFGPIARAMEAATEADTNNREEWAMEKAWREQVEADLAAARETIAERDATIAAVTAERDRLRKVANLIPWAVIATAEDGDRTLVMACRSRRRADMLASAGDRESPGLTITVERLVGAAALASSTPAVPKAERGGES